MYNQPIYNPQTSIDRINNQIAELERLKNQIPQVPAINQTFQLANSSGIKYANNINEVLIDDTPYFSKDMSILWIKNNNDIKSYELNEIIQKDEKDLQIDFLKAQIEELKKGMKDEPSINNNVNEPTESKKSTNVSTDKSIKTK